MLGSVKQSHVEECHLVDNAPDNYEDNRMHVKNWIESLPHEISAAVKSRMSRLSLVDGQFIYRRGESSTEIYLILSGEVRMLVNSWEGKEWLAVSFQAGESFGETSALDDDVRPHDAISHGATQLAVLQQKDLRELQTRYPEIGKELISFLCQRIRMGYSLSTDAALLSLPSLMASRLLLIATQYGNLSLDDAQQDLKLTHQDMAHMMGASRQAVSKILKQWEAKGLIEISYGQIALRNIDGLKLLVEQY